MHVPIIVNDYNYNVQFCLNCEVASRDNDDEDDTAYQEDLSKLKITRLLWNECPNVWSLKDTEMKSCLLTGL